MKLLTIADGKVTLEFLLGPLDVVRFLARAQRPVAFSETSAMITGHGKS